MFPSCSRKWAKPCPKLWLQHFVVWRKPLLIAQAIGFLLWANSFSFTESCQESWKRAMESLFQLCCKKAEAPTPFHIKNESLQTVACRRLYCICSLQFCICSLLNTFGGSLLWTMLLWLWTISSHSLISITVHTFQQFQFYAGFHSVRLCAKLKKPRMLNLANTIQSHIRVTCTVL